MAIDRHLTIVAPLSGPLVELEMVPDPVFAQKMVGDGISIDPVSNILCAPCEGVITQIHSSQHAVTIQTEIGVEIMMHIGIDTVSLNGEGFTALVCEGDPVKATDPLIEFDMDYVAVNAKSLLTQIVVTNSEIVTFERSSGTAVSGESSILTLELIDDTGSEVDLESFEPIMSEPITIANPVGLHARPSAVLSNSAKKFSSTIEIICGKRRGNAKSTTSIMKMEVAHGESVIIAARGADNGEAVAHLSSLISEGLGENVVSSNAPIECFEETVETSRKPLEFNSTLNGVSASPGIVIGQIRKLKKQVLVIEEYGSDDPLIEKKLLTSSIEKSVLGLRGLINASESGESEIFEAHIELLDDPEMLDVADREIEKGKSAAFAWQKAYTQQADGLAALENELLAGRANDLRDVGERTLTTILGLEIQSTEMPPDTILIAEDLTPSQTASLDRDNVLGFCTVQGGASSHVAILARSLDIPAIAGIDSRILEIEDGAPAVLNGTKGTLELNASEERILEVNRELALYKQKRAEELKHCNEPAVTADGHTVTIVGNAGGLEEVQSAVKNGGEGIGLLRSEFLFQNRSSAPTEEDQAEVYTSMVRALTTERPLVIRTLDVGGDKPLPYLPISKEDNPFLGERGIRVCLNRPELLRTQLRAILSASTEGTIEVMFPMISSLAEFRKAKTILSEECDAMGVPMVKTGIMVEVPVVAAMAEQFAREVDFFSVGTNDLAQYTMAVDRGHPKLAPLADGLNPGMLALIANAAEAAHKYGKTISVCGGIASDPQAVPVLIGLGIDKLSTTVPAIPTVKAQVRILKRTECEMLAEKALASESAADVRALVETFCQKMK